MLDNARLVLLYRAAITIRDKREEKLRYKPGKLFQGFPLLIMNAKEASSYEEGNFGADRTLPTDGFPNIDRAL